MKLRVTVGVRFRVGALLGYVTFTFHYDGTIIPPRIAANAATNSKFKACDSFSSFCSSFINTFTLVLRYLILNVMVRVTLGITYLTFSLSFYLQFNDLGDFEVPPKYSLRSVRVYLILSFYGYGYVDYSRSG